VGGMSSRLRVTRHRERLLAQGLRPVQFLVVDLRQQAVRMEVHRQATAVGVSRTTGEMLHRLHERRCLSLAPWTTAILPPAAP